MSELTVMAGYARALLDLAAAKGANRHALAERSGIAAEALHDADARIPFAKFVALMRAGKELSGDQALGLHFGEAIDLSKISIVGLIGRACETMAEAFLQLNRYRGLVVEVDLETAERFSLAYADGGIWMIDNRRSPNDFLELTESTMARIVCGCSRMIAESGWSGEAPSVKAVHFTHADPGYRAEYERIFRAPVTFGSDKNAMLVDPSWPAHRLAIQPRYVFGVLSSHADALLANLERSKTAAGRVESLLLPALHTGDIGIDAIAEKMGTSRWTLARKLKAEGVTFEQVLDGLRHKMALQYLSGTKASVNETAYLVGFSEPAAFSRAFKRWTGKSPREALASKNPSGADGA